MNSENWIYISSAAAVYMLAHLLRALRFWLLLKRADLSLRENFVIFQVTNTIGGVVSALGAEVLRIAALVGWAGRASLIPVLSISLFCRLLDFVVASLPLVLNSLVRPEDPILDSHALLAFMLIGVFLGLMGFSHSAVSFLKKVLVARGSTRLHLHLIRGLSEIEKSFYTFLEHRASTLMFNILLTVLIWGCDVLAFLQIAPLVGVGVGGAGAAVGASEKSLWGLMSLWSEHAYGRFFGLTVAGIDGHLLYEFLILPQVLLALGLLAWAMGMRFRTLKERKWINHSS